MAHELMQRLLPHCPQAPHELPASPPRSCHDLVAQIAGKEPLRATAKDFQVKNPGLVFRVGGKAGQEVLVDNVKVWELK